MARRRSKLWLKVKAGVVTGSLVDYMVNKGQTKLSNHIEDMKNNYEAALSSMQSHYADVMPSRWANKYQNKLDAMKRDYEAVYKNIPDHWAKIFRTAYIDANGGTAK